MDNNLENNKDFQEFLVSDGHSPPKQLSDDILYFVHRDLNPSHRLVFIKLLLIQTVVGIVTMLFCPQFELSLTNNYDLFHFFHRQFGRTICMAICGGIFMGSGAVAAAFILKGPELRKISRTPLLYYFSISSIFLLGFLLLGANVYVEISAAWIVGACLVGSAAHLLSRKARQMISAPAS